MGRENYNWKGISYIQRSFLYTINIEVIPSTCGFNIALVSTLHWWSPSAATNSNQAQQTYDGLVQNSLFLYFLPFNLCSFYTWQLACVHSTVDYWLACAWCHLYSFYAYVICMRMYFVNWCWINTLCYMFESDAGTLWPTLTLDTDASFFEKEEYTRPLHQAMHTSILLSK